VQGNASKAGKAKQREEQDDDERSQRGGGTSTHMQMGLSVDGFPSAEYNH